MKYKIEVENMVNEESTLKNKISFWELFWIMLKISSVTFGGGFVIISMMQKEFVEKRSWITVDEMQDMVVISQTAPGSIAVNTAILVGYKMRRIKGIIACVLGTALPPVVILTIISMFYTQFSQAVYIAAVLKGMQAGVAAIVMDVAFSMCFGVVKEKNPWHIILMIITFAAVFVAGIGAVTVILVCGALGIAIAIFRFIKDRRLEK